MHDSALPPPSSPNPSSGPAPVSGGDDVGYEAAYETVGAVIAWYSRQLLHARRSGDQQRLEELKAERQECVEDQHRLREAGPEEITRIAAVYTARLNELEASEPPPEP
ncbi:hypothetical protein BX261_7307 [Streptomyces sp. 2321.6]|uniref:hypothetical protein n=1 Tax=Streptomyces sp. 2321.6 TaxID=1938840 RepID=UPI000BDCCBC1|nr:hypothetical protein [Streptomyces sp. 2321.6]PBC72371.1 hypothetical protein BX261_7244 [Streptomyces sp. 2321.6]PBC72432.1 hypothetical protein BX261_7307 [Streptomyces sp. 2321.6]